MLEFDGEEKFNWRSGMDTYQLRIPYCSPKKPILNCTYWNLKLQNLVKVEINIFFYNKEKKIQTSDTNKKSILFL